MSSNLRGILHSAFSFVRGTEINKATAALTMDHLIQEHINSLKKGEVREVLDGQGSSVGNRPSRWDRLEALEKEIDQAVAAITAAGSDVDKLKELGIFEADPTTTADEAASASASVSTT